MLRRTPIQNTNPIGRRADFTPENRSKRNNFPKPNEKPFVVARYHSSGCCCLHHRRHALALGATIDLNLRYTHGLLQSWMFNWVSADDERRSSTCTRDDSVQRGNPQINNVGRLTHAAFFPRIPDVPGSPQGTLLDLLRVWSVISAPRNSRKAHGLMMPRFFAALIFTSTSDSDGGALVRCFRELFSGAFVPSVFIYNDRGVGNDCDVACPNPGDPHPDRRPVHASG